MATARMVALRTPLARVQLAASQLQREAVTPLAQRLASSIADAVVEMDHRIGEILSAWVPAAAPALDPDVSPVLDALRERVAPSLRARGVTWEPLAERSQPIPGNASLVHRGAVVLLRDGVRLAGKGGRLQMGLQSEEGWLGIRLDVESHGTPEDGSRQLDEPRAFALSSGGRLELVGELPEQVTLWLPQGGNPCGAS